MFTVHLELTVPPETRFRYRYDTEMSGTHGSLQGVRQGGEKCVPTVELVNFPYEALIRLVFFSFLKIKIICLFQIFVQKTSSYNTKYLSSLYN